MSRPNSMSEQEAISAIEALPNWTIKSGKLHRTFQFTDFSAAWGFMSRVALVAERMDHHPEWLNIYSTVRVDLSTHDAGGITILDLQLARAMSALFDPE